MTMATSDTKGRLLAHGTALLQEFGYSDTGLQDIVQASGIPKGSFYHHFRNKEDFGLQAVEQYAERSGAQLDAHLSDPSVAPVERIRGFFDEMFADWTRNDCRKGCLLGTLGQELADVSPAFRHLIRDSLNQWSDRIAACLAEAQDRGEIPVDIDCRATAERIVDGFQGAALRMKLERSPEPLKGFCDLFFDTILASHS